MKGQKILKDIDKKTKQKEVCHRLLNLSGKEFQVISHPNVTKFYGFCYNETKEYAMLTFELVDIGSLADFMKVLIQ